MWRSLASALGSGPRGRRFKSCHPDHFGGLILVTISDEILKNVEKPGRYIGNEWNMVKKDHEDVKIRFVFCFPDIYEVGMSHLGMKILYHLINEREDTYCERVFAPWADMEYKMRQNNIPLFSLETKDPISLFDIVGFTLQYEMSYTNVINMLDLGGIPIKAEERKEGCPFVCAGGPCTYNPEPLADFIDFFVLGEGEEVINEILDAYKIWKESGSCREDFLKTIALIEGVYVPKFYKAEYNSDGTIIRTKPINTGFPEKIKKRIIKNINDVYFPEKIIVPYLGIIHDRIMLEIFRGCIRGCRFCQAGFAYKPHREKDWNKLVDIAKKSEDYTGYEEISLMSLSTSDYSYLDKLSEELIKEMAPRKVSLSFPSLRIDSFSLELMEMAHKVRKSGLTFAPEAGTQRLRNAINKGVTEEDLLNSAELAFSGGWDNIKLYFMMGLPTEEYDDIEAIADLCEKIVKIYESTPKEKRGKNLNITISASAFVPKPFTPFQWEAQDTIPIIKNKQMHLKNILKSKKLKSVKYNWSEPELSMLEAVLSRGDRRIGDVLLTAWRKGCKFDAWGDQVRFDKWMESFEECGIDPAFYANRKRCYDEIFPWEHIEVGIKKEFLFLENKKAYLNETTPNCRIKCSNCGISVFGGGICCGC